MKREKLLASGAWLLMVSAIVAQSPVDGGKVPSPLSPYGQIGSAVIKKEQGANEKKDLELPAMEVDKVPIGAIPREEAAPLYPRFFLSGEYLAWKLNNTTVNPIVFNVPVGIVGAPIAIDNGFNSSSFIAYASLTPQSQAALSQNGIINYGMENGMRFTGGLALEQDTGLSILLNAIIIPTSSYNLSSNTSFNMVPINFQTGLESQVALGSNLNANTEVATVPIVVPRNIASQVYASANNFVGGGEVDLKGRDLIFGDVLFSGLLGFRYFQFNESLGVNSIYNITQPPGIPSPDAAQGLQSNFSQYQSITSISSDNIKVYNNFLGPQIGINSNYNFKRVTFDCNGKLGIGVQHQVVTINSSTTQTFVVNSTNGATTTTSNQVQNYAAGVLFSPYDVGRHSRNQFGLIPELNLKLGYRLFDRLKITAGYDFLLMANVLRASNQTQLIPYTTQSNFSGLAAQQQTSSQTIQIPAFTFDNSNLIINGLNVGMQLDF